MPCHVGFGMHKHVTLHAFGCLFVSLCVFRRVCVCVCVVATLTSNLCAFTYPYLSHSEKDKHVLKSKFTHMVI